MAVGRYILAPEEIKFFQILQWISLLPDNNLNKPPKHNYMEQTNSSIAVFGTIITTEAQKNISGQVLRKRYEHARS